MQQVAAAWLMLDATGSAAMVGVLGLAQRGPSLFLTPLAGRLADRRDRRTLLVRRHRAAVRGGVGLTAAAALGAAIPAVLIALSLVGGIGQTLAWPAQLATVSSLVPRSLLPDAVSLNSAGFNLARVVGPAVAGGFLLIGGATACFALNALSFLPLLRVIRRLPQASAGARDAAATVRGAVRHALDSPALRRLMTGCAIFAFCAAPLSVLMPVYAHDLGRRPGGARRAARGVRARRGGGLDRRAAARPPRAAPPPDPVAPCWPSPCSPSASPAPRPGGPPCRPAPRRARAGWPSSARPTPRSSC